MLEPFLKNNLKVFPLLHGQDWHCNESDYTKFGHALVSELRTLWY